MRKLRPGERLCQVRGRPQAQGPLPASTEQPGSSMSAGSQGCRRGVGAHRGCTRANSATPCCCRWGCQPWGSKRDVKPAINDLDSVNHRMAMAPGPPFKAMLTLTQPCHHHPMEDTKGPGCKTLSSSEVTPLPEILFPILSSTTSVTPCPESLMEEATW